MFILICFAMASIGTLNSGVGAITSLSSTFVPQYIWYTAATQLTGLRISIQGQGVICDLDAAGLSALGIVLFQGRRTNTYMIPMATGFMPGKNVTYTFTNSAAQTPTIFYTSNQYAKQLLWSADGTPVMTTLANGDLVQATDPGFFVTCTSQQALASSGIKVVKFFAAAFPNAGAGDLFNVLYADNFQDTNIAREDLAEWLQFKQALTNTASDYMVINNLQNVQQVDIIPTATQFVYVMQFVAPGVKFGVTDALN